MARADIYSGPPRGLYRPHLFLIFMDQGQSGSSRRPVELLDFKYGTTFISAGPEHQIWHIHHYGVTLDYRLKDNNVIIQLFGENIPLIAHGILSKPPISEVERIIKEEANNMKYKKMELEWEASKILDKSSL